MNKVIAFYLPQYHPTPDNDNWWGKGFTEWTNVAKAKPLFRGHDQPKVPSELGFYDLRFPVVREKQVELAKVAGVAGFCYYHYWFGDGKRELEFPFNEVLISGKPDFPFCLCWANESWHSKSWNKDGAVSKKMLIEQLYLGKEDNEKHFYSLLKAFMDPRYITYKGKPVFMVYRPAKFPNVTKFISQWNKLAKQNGLAGFHFVAQSRNNKETEEFLSMGFDAVNLIRMFNLTKSRPVAYQIVMKPWSVICRDYLKRPFIQSYKSILPYMIGEEEKIANIYPTIMPNWDHTPRSGSGGYMWQDCTPELFYKHVQKALETIKDKNDVDKIVFLKSWNEWGEGNYMEPDLKYGRGFINALATALNER